MNQSGVTTNFRKDNEDYEFNLTGDTNWYGGLVLAAASYNVIINLNGYNLYINTLYIGWVDSSTNYNCNLVVNGSGTIVIDN